MLLAFFLSSLLQEVIHRNFLIISVLKFNSDSHSVLFEIALA